MHSCRSLLRQFKYSFANFSCVLVLSLEKQGFLVTSLLHNLYHKTCINFESRNLLRPSLSSPQWTTSLNISAELSGFEIASTLQTSPFGFILYSSGPHPQGPDQYQGPVGQLELGHKEKITKKHDLHFHSSGFIYNITLKDLLFWKTTGISPPHLTHSWCTCLK